MLVFQETLTVGTEAPIQILNITTSVQRVVASSRVHHGSVTVLSPHTTAYISLNEQETNLQRDMLEFLGEFLPPEQAYLHDAHPIDQRKNARAHLIGLFMPASATIPIAHSAMLLGGWQSIFLIELDGPRASRNVVVQVMGIH